MDKALTQSEQESSLNAFSDELLANKIPPRPAVLLGIQKEMRKLEPDFVELATLISADVGISASLVKIANSPLFGVRHHIRSVREAVQVLGLNSVASAVAALSLKQVFSSVPNLERFWDSSARIAQLSGWLSNQLVLPGLRLKPEEVYTFGLFRDCGIPVLLSMYADYLDILKAANNAPDQPFTDIEENELSVHHAMIGAMLVREWELPDEFQVGIEWHHDAETLRGIGQITLPEISRIFVAIAQLSERLFQELTGFNKTCEWEKLGHICLDILGIDEDRLHELKAQAQQEGVYLHPAF